MGPECTTCVSCLVPSSYIFDRVIVQNCSKSITLRVHTNQLLIRTFPSNCTMYMKDVLVYFLLGWKVFPLWVIFSSGWFWRFQSVFPSRWFHACRSQRVRRWSMYLGKESYNGPSSTSTVVICHKVAVCRRHGRCVPPPGFSEIG